MSFMGRFRRDSPSSHAQSSPGSGRSSFSFFNRAASPQNVDSGGDRNNSSPSDSSVNGFGGMFGRRESLSRDPKVSAARQKVKDALAAEREADRALLDARKKVQLAKEHAKLLEREALGEARRAKAKQAEAQKVNETVKGLGRYG